MYCIILKHTLKHLKSSYIQYILVHLLVLIISEQSGYV
jgi:hypothetical protein